MQASVLLSLPLCLLLTLLSCPAYGLDTEYFGYCKDAQAFEDVTLSIRKAIADWVCSAPTAAETGAATERNTLRCLLDQRENCQLDAGGSEGSRGAHVVARGQWYWAAGQSEDFPDVRCECGCFPGDVKILTHLGEMRIDSMSQLASSLGGISAAVIDENTSSYKGSARLTNQDFVVGPENSPLVQVVTSSGKSLRMTDQHPVLVQRNSAWQMVEAAHLRLGDTLRGADGAEETLSEISAYLPAEQDRLVYNFDSRGATDSEHTIIANNIRVGDLNWQKRLSERRSRIANFLKHKKDGAP